MDRQSSVTKTGTLHELPFWLINSSQTATLKAEIGTLRAQVRKLQLQLLLVSYRADSNLKLAKNMISDESYLVSDEESLASFARIKIGLSALGMLQRMLIISDDRNAIDLKVYLEMYGEALGCAISSGLQDKVVQVDVDSLLADAAVANALGTLISELAVSVFKHASPTACINGVSVSLKRDGHQLVLRVGTSSLRKKPANIRARLGNAEIQNNRLLKLLLNDLGGKFVTSYNNGTCVECIFPASILGPQAG